MVHLATDLAESGGYIGRSWGDVHWVLAIGAPHSKTPDAYVRLSAS